MLRATERLDFPNTELYISAVVDNKCHYSLEVICRFNYNNENLTMWSLYHELIALDQKGLAPFHFTACFFLTQLHCLPPFHSLMASLSLAVSLRMNISNVYPCLDKCVCVFAVTDKRRQETQRAENVLCLQGIIIKKKKT